MRNKMGTVIAAAAIVWLTFVTAVRSEEVVVAESVILRGGLICDTLDEVKEFMQLVDKGGGPHFETVPGCGLLKGETPARVVRVGWHVAKEGMYPIYRYEMLTEPPVTQFGIGSPVFGRGA